MATPRFAPVAVISACALLAKARGLAMKKQSVKNHAVKKRDKNIVLAAMGQISLGVRVVKSKKLYDRKAQKMALKSIKARFY